jgi:hypothetical protein
MISRYPSMTPAAMSAERMSRIAAAQIHPRLDDDGWSSS